jgi:hypothetical protein
MSKVTRALLAAASVALAGTALGAAPAAADNVDGSAGPSGPIVRARITFTGDTTVGGGGERSVGVPAKCWWEPISADVLLGNPPIDANDPESAAEYFDWAQRNSNGSFSFARLTLPSQEAIDDAIRRRAAGENITWYHGQCIEGVDPVEEGFLELGGVVDGTNLGVGFQAFPTGDPPEPIVAAETLAQEALQVLRIDNPAVDRNPKIGLGGSQAALVTLPTYFWLTNVGTALGFGPDGPGYRSVTATAGTASATVEAKTAGIGITAPAGALEQQGCDAEKIARPYSEGAAPGSLCTVKFTRASVGQGAGWPVTVATEWDVEWFGVEANGEEADGGPLPLLNPTQSTINVPVAESQAVVESTES